MKWLFLAACLFLLPPSSIAAEPWPRHTIDDSSRGADGVKLMDFNGDGLPDIVTGWEQGGVARLCLHPGHAKARQPWPAVTVGPAPNVEDAAPMDLDGDGAAEVVSCCEGRTRTIFVHSGPLDPGRLLDASAWKTEPLAESVNRMMWMFCAPMQVDGRRGSDLLAAGKGEGAAIGWFESPENPRDLAAWRWHEIGPVGWMMSIKTLDMDGDGDLDVLVSDRKGAQRGVRWLENPGKVDEQVLPWRNRTIGGTDREVMFLAVADLDGDGVDEIVCACKDAPILVLQPSGGRSWKAFDVAMPRGAGSGKAVAVGDLDQDGRADLVFSCEHAQGDLSGVGWLALGGFPSRPDYTAYDISGPMGIKYDLLELYDVDGDGDLDVIGCEESQAVDGRSGGLGVFWYENRRVVRSGPSGSSMHGQPDFASRNGVHGQPGSGGPP